MLSHFLSHFCVATLSVLLWNLRLTSDQRIILLFCLLFIFYLFLNFASLEFTWWFSFRVVADWVSPFDWKSYPHSSHLRDHFGFSLLSCLVCYMNTLLFSKFKPNNEFFLNGKIFSDSNTAGVCLFVCSVVVFLSGTTKVMWNWSPRCLCFTFWWSFICADYSWES